MPVGHLKRSRFRKGKGKPPVGFADGFYLNEIRLNCEFTFSCAGEMQQLQATNRKHPSQLAMAHMLLVFASDVSKLLSPAPKAIGSARERAERLRSRLQLRAIDLKAAVGARNFLEHFDERLDRLLGSHPGLLIGRFIDDHTPEEVELDDGRRLKPAFLQHLNTTTLDLVLYDQAISLKKSLLVSKPSRKPWMSVQL